MTQGNNVRSYTSTSVVQRQRAGLWYPSSAGSNPAEAVGFFRAKKKILSTPPFGREVKPFVPCRIFAACKRTRKCMRGSHSFRSKLPAISRPSSSSFRYQGLWWRYLAVQVGTTKDQAVVHPGALAAGTMVHGTPPLSHTLSRYDATVSVLIQNLKRK